MDDTKLPLILVEWLDAWADATAAITERDVGDSHKPEVIRTLGWLLKEDEAGISLACEYCADGSYRGRSFIPKGMVSKVTHYKLTKPRKRPETTKATKSE